MKINDEESKPWPCLVPNCFKSFKRKGDLTRHRLLHSGVKRYGCEHCKKRFAQYSGLKTHQNTHSGKKPYNCGFPGCTSAFGDPSSCARHRKETHRRIVAYTCPHERCKSSIKRRSAFAAHLRKHSIDPSEVDIDSMAPPLLPVPLLIPRRRSIRGIPSVVHSERSHTEKLASIEGTRKMWQVLSNIEPNYPNPSPPSPLFANDYNTLFQQQEYIYPQHNFQVDMPTMLPELYSVNSTPGSVTPPHLTYSASPSPSSSGSRIDTPQNPQLTAGSLVNMPVFVPSGQLSPSIPRDDLQLSYFPSQMTIGYHNSKAAFNFPAYDHPPGVHVIHR